MDPTSSSKAGKPIYYGSSKNTPIYYGSAHPGTPVYGGTGNGVPYYAGQPAAVQDQSDSLMGQVTVGRMFRVIVQRWISVLVFLLVGLIAAFAVYRISPTIYEAQSEFTMDMRRPGNNNDQLSQVIPDYGTTYEEVFNTRLSDWRSDKIITRIVQQYRAKFPASTVTDKEIIGCLEGSEMELVRHSRLITIAIRSTSEKLAAALANAYAEAIEAFTDEENKLRCDKAVSQIHEQVEKHRRADDSAAKRLLEFRTKHKLDILNAEREIIQQSLHKTTQDVLTLETEVTAAEEWEKVLRAAQETPEDFGALPSAVPRSSEIGQAYIKLQEAKMEMTALLANFTKNHPEVKAKEKALESIRQHFVETVSRALATAHGNLAALRNQLAVAKKKSEGLRADHARIEQKIVTADAGLKQLEQEKKVASELYLTLLTKENEARIAAEQNNEIVRVGRPATVPKRPVLPNPVIIFSVGVVVSLGLGILFVLVLDHLEDTVVSLSDIEVRLGLKVLAVLPHVRRKKREQVARFISEDKYSHFAESVAGLRNLLDSPRYQAISQVLLLISTQPGEGKTITSCSIALSSASAGKKTLLVDFDLRRPRMARVWNLDLDREHSFSHNLSKGLPCDFAKLVKPSGVDNLSLIASQLPEDVDPASIMGSGIIPEFFQWARANYDRVIIDSPPFGVVGDVMTLAAMVDSVMIMCCPDRTHFRPIQFAARSLAESGATVIGVVVNDVEFDESRTFAQGGGSYGGYSYSRYGGYRSYGHYAPYGPKPTAAKTGDPALSAPADAAATKRHQELADED